MASRMLSSWLLLFALAAPLAGCGDVEARAQEDEATGAALLPTTAASVPAYAIYEGELSAEASTVPWSSWWFPSWDDLLFKGRNGELSPLEKYDLYNQNVLGKTTNAAGYERDKLHDEHAAAWSGLCFAWALASILEPEPRAPRTFDKLRFSVGDLKALLLKTYEGVKDVPTVGDRNDAAWDDDYQDIYPHLFHLAMLAELFQNRRAFIIDKDPGPEVWNEPVYKAVTRVTHDPQVRDVVHVRTVVFVASSHVNQLDYLGTQTTTREYTYDLRGYWDRSNRFIVLTGTWTGDSRWDHPDFVMLRPDKPKRQSLNKEIDVATVDAILGRSP